MSASSRQRRRPAALTAAVATLVVALAGCGGDPGDAPQRGSATGLAASRQTPAPSPSPSSAAPLSEITLAFAGDVHFTDRTAKLLGNPATAFGPIASTLSAADLTVLNLETAVTERGTMEPKTYHFRAPATAFTALKAAGVDVVSLANNHVLDYGQVGFADTLAAAGSAGFPILGAGRSATEAYAPWTTEIRGTRIAIFGFSQIHDLASTWVATDTRPGIAMAWDVDRATAAVAAARRSADLVIVFNHWGEERNSCPTADQKSFATRLADAGADLIIGSHAHTLQGDGYLKSSYVAYGLGNFVWYSNSGSTDTGVLQLTVRGRQVLSSRLVPAVVSANGQPLPSTGANATRITQRFAGLRGCAGLADHPTA